MRRILFLLLVIAVAPAWAQSAADLRGTWPAWEAPKTGQKVDPQPYPTGIDLAFVPGVPLALSRTATLQRADIPPARQLGWPSLIAVLENSGRPLVIRLIGVSAKARLGEAVTAGQTLGMVADAAPLWPGAQNHITLEVYLDGKRVDPRPWATRLLPQGVVIQPLPPAQANVLWPQWALRAEALRLAKMGDNTTALARLRAGLRLPAWKTSNLDLAEDMALAAQAAKDSRAEAAALKRALALARAEIPYAQGLPPVALLGPVSAARSPASLYGLERRLEQRLTALGSQDASDDDD